MSRYPCCGTNLEVLLPLFVKAFSVSCNFQSVGTVWIIPVLLIQYKLTFKKFHGFNSFISFFKKKKRGKDINNVLGYLDVTKLIVFDTSEEIMLEPIIATSYDFCFL